ncbi:SRR1-domain-containing protein [Mycena rosella]|uniref:SRR1-domain-containing protein n=1 Tax=Mycena rosella TaxID=1033263 RepID=A0AAD7DL12_MYCRO|nr:SRR1-domain-containing protein [Mycena rosella]
MTSNNTGFKYSDFKPVVSRKKRKNKAQLERPSLVSLVRQAREELAKDGWNSRCQQMLREHLTGHSLSPSRVLCLGLGSPSDSPNSRFQLAFLLELCHSMDIEHGDVSVYDPVFSEEDDALFEELQMGVLSENKEGRYSLDSPTILWMPHCDLDLYENILGANWSPEQLANVILISNRLGDYVDSNPRHKLETRAPCLLRIEVMECSLLPVSIACTTAFNTLAIQSIGRNMKMPESWFGD